MRVVGGKMGPDGGLGAFVTYVMKGGPADVNGICEGKNYSQVTITLVTFPTAITHFTNLYPIGIISLKKKALIIENGFYIFHQGAPYFSVNI